MGLLTKDAGHGGFAFMPDSAALCVNPVEEGCVEFKANGVMADSPDKVFQRLLSIAYTSQLPKMDEN